MKFFKNFVRTPVFALCVLMVSKPVFAGYNIGGPASGPFAALGRWMQTYVDFMDGPFAVAAVLISIILAFLAWNFLPREGIIAPVVKAVISGVVLLNLGTWVTSFASA